jgi:hypothetical protein
MLPFQYIFISFSACIVCNDWPDTPFDVPIKKWRVENKNGNKSGAV